VWRLCLKSRVTNCGGNAPEPTGPSGYGAGGPNANQGHIGGTRQVVVAASAPEALALHDKMAKDLWHRALKGPAAVRFMRELMDRP